MTSIAQDGATLEPAQSPRKKRRGRRELKELIIAAASELFARKGYAEPTIREIADAAQVVLPTLYRIFADKRDIYEQCCKRAAAKQLSGFRETLREETTGELMIYRMLSDSVLQSLGKGQDYTLLARAAMDGQRDLLNTEVLSTADEDVFLKYAEVFQRGSRGDHPHLRMMLFDRVFCQLPTAFALGPGAELTEDSDTFVRKTLEILLPGIDWDAVGEQYRREHPKAATVVAIRDRARRSA